MKGVILVRCYCCVNDPKQKKNCNRTQPKKCYGKSAWRNYWM